MSTSKEELIAKEPPMPICADCKYNISCSTWDGKYYSINCKKHVTSLLTRPFWIICSKYKEKKKKKSKKTHLCTCGCCDKEELSEEKEI